jgi:hypothetical protein
MSNSPVTPAANDRTDDRTGVRVAVFLATVVQTSVTFVAANCSRSEHR